MTAPSNISLIGFVSTILQQECDEDYEWIKSMWRVLSKKLKKMDFDKADVLKDYTHINYADITDDDYATMAKYMPVDINTFVGSCILKLREAIISEKVHRSMGSWKIKLQPDDLEETNVLAYLLSVIYFLLTIDGSDVEEGHVARAFTLLTMLMRLWRKSMPSACVDISMDVDSQGVRVTKYKGEDTLPDGYEAIQNLFIAGIEWLEDYPEQVKLLTKDILYDISIIVRMPVSFILGIHITKLCSCIANLSEIPVGDNIDFCDVESTKIDLVFSWVYHMFLNTPPNLKETLCENVGGAISIFAHLFKDDDEITPERHSINCANVTNFFINIKEHIMNSFWFPEIFATMGYNYSRNKEFSRILVALPCHISWKVIQIMINKKYVAETAEVCANCLILLNSTTINTDTEEEREELLLSNSKLLYYTLCPFANDVALETFPKLDTAVILRILQGLYNLVLQPGRQFFTDLSNYICFDGVITRLICDPLNIVNMLSNYMSISWRHAIINQLIINIWCKFVTSSDTVRPHNLKRIVLLVENSNACDLIPCLDNLKSIIPFIIHGGLDEDVIVKILNNLLRHALNPGSMAHAYVRVLYHAIFDGEMVEHRRRVAYSIIGCICNNNSSPRLFQMFRELHLLTIEIVREIVNVYVTHNEPIAWKLMHRSLQVMEYTAIPQYMTNMLQSFLRIQVLCSGFAVDTQLAFFGSMLSIIKYRRARILIGNGDTEFFNLLNTFLRQSFSTSHCTSQVQLLFLDLVTELRMFMPATDQWVHALFQRSQDTIIEYLSMENYYETSATRLGLFKEVSKTLGDMALRLNILPSDRLMKLMASRIRNSVTRDIPFPVIICYSLNWSTLSLLFSKLCLREPRFVTLYVETMHHILRNGRDTQKSMIIEAMADICTLHMDNISIIMPLLKEYLACRSYLQVSACQSLLQLLNTVNVRLKRTEYMMLISLIATEEKTLRDVFMKLFEEKLLPNNSDLILSNFIPMILYFHEVFNHPDYLLNSTEMIQMHSIPGIMENRCVVYNSLLKYIRTSDKFQLMLKIATDLISVLHHRRLPHSNEAVRMLPDAYKVIYIVTKTIDDKYDIPNEATEMYKNLFTQMESMEKQSAYLFMNYDETIKEILVILLAMLEDIHTVHPSMFQDTFHLIMFIIATFYANISSMVVSAPDTSFAAAVKTLPVLYNRYDRSFESYNADIYRP